MAAVLGNQVSHATTTALMNMKMKGRQYDGSEYQPKRKVGQKPIDPFCSLIAEAGERAYRDNHVIPVIPAHPYHSKDMLPGHSTRLNPIMAATPKWVHTIYFKPLKNAAGARIPQFFSSICFTPDGRRFVTANNLGEFTLWHGTSLASEMRTMGHEDAQVSSTVWCEQADFMISSDSKGAVKYWGRNMNNLKSIEAAQNPIRELSASPSASKFACGSTDGLIKLFDTDSARLVCRRQHADTIHIHPQPHTPPHRNGRLRATVTKCGRATGTRRRTCSPPVERTCGVARSSCGTRGLRRA